MAKVLKMEHVGIVVNDLAAAAAFFRTLGFAVDEESAIEGEWVERIIGLDDVKMSIAMAELPDGQGTLELIKFQRPADESAPLPPLANVLGIRHIAFTVDDLEALVAMLRKQGGQTIGEIQNYENIFKLCYVRGPEGIIVEFAERRS